MPSPMNRSYPHESAAGICDNCGAIVTFNPNEQEARCGCGTRTNRTCAGAVSSVNQGFGYRVGENVTVKHPRR